jgi:hypothetical protein
MLPGVASLKEGESDRDSGTVGTGTGKTATTALAISSERTWHVSDWAMNVRRSGC